MYPSIDVVIPARTLAISNHPSVDKIVAARGVEHAPRELGQVGVVDSTDTAGKYLLGRHGEAVTSTPRERV
jgi:hypothetical protein